MSGVTRDRSADEAALATSAFTAGQQAFWRGLGYHAAVQAGGEAHVRPNDFDLGWYAAACEGARMLAESGDLIRGRRGLEQALAEAAATIRVLVPAKPTPRQRELALRTLDALAHCLALVAPTAVAAAPSARDARSSSREKDARPRGAAPSARDARRQP